MASFKTHEAVTSRREMFMVNPSLIKVEEGYNIRDLNTIDAIQGIATLAESIRENGLKVPLVCRIKGDDVTLVQGHRRLKAIQKLLNEGVEFKAVPVVPEASSTSEEDRIIDLVLSNSGEPLSPLEKAGVIGRLEKLGYSDTDISRRLAMSAAYVGQLKLLLSAPSAIREAVRQGDIAASAAVSVMRTHGDQASLIVQEAVTEAKKTGKRVSGADMTGSKVKAVSKANKTKALEEFVLWLDNLGELDISDCKDIQNRVSKILAEYEIKE